MTETKTVQKKAVPAKKKEHATIDVLHVNADNLIVGRLASCVAQDLLRGKKIIIINAEKAVFTGNPVVLNKEWQKRLDLRPKGNPELGPRFSKMPDRILRKIIEGMLPAKKERGRNAMNRLEVYIGVPSEYSGKKFEPIARAQNTKTKGITTILSLSQSLGYNKM